MNISSIIVKTLPKNINILIEQLKNIPNVDYHFHDEIGHIIVTIEAQNVSEEVAILNTIESLENVISANMSYAYSEKELEQERSKIGKSEQDILDKLDDNNEEVVYSGSVFNHIHGKKK